MALIRELPNTRDFDISVDGASFDAEFFVWEAINEVDVELTVFAYAPLFYLGLTRGKLKSREVAPGMWMCSLNYSTLSPQQATGQDPPQPQIPQPENVIGPEFGFDTTGATTQTL